MREKELRLALVCYGGISLAVYMHGITKEVWRLARASRALHANAAEAGEAAEGESSEPGYRRLLEAVRAAGVDLGVLVDIVAGASAGGINGIFLAQAIASGQSLEPLTALWLERADVEVLLDPEARAGSRFAKFWAMPIVWAAGRTGDTIEQTVEAGARAEVRAKLASFVRARWFEPPFGGAQFTGVLLDALQAMAAAPAGPPLLPPGQPLDLIVTVTDFGGHPERLRLNSPAEVVETEHRLTIAFKDPGLPDEAGRRRLAHVAELVFAGRATASFPGAFPPFTVGELDGVLAGRAMRWPGRDGFLARTLPRHSATGTAEDAVLIDGSVLANAPFRPAIEALKDRPARREIDRRFVYIDPKPGRHGVRLSGKDGEAGPGFFATILGALSDIPREQPIRDNLEAIEARSARIRRMRAITRAIRPEVERAIEAAIGSTFFLSSPTPARLAAWRNRANAAAASGAGYAYASYGFLKLSGLVEELAATLCAILPHSERPALEPLRAALDGAVAAAGLSAAEALSAAGATPALIAFYRSHDLGFRIRRLRFLARRLGSIETEETRVQVQRVRDSVYAALAPYLERERPGFYDESCRAAARIATRAPQAALDWIAQARDLRGVDAQCDQAIAVALDLLPKQERRAALLAYLGFSFYDIATLPLLQGEGLDEFDPVKVDRIAPEDARSIREGGAEATLKGIQFNSFGAFFSRAYRENDYLWGRLHGAERLVDIVASTLPAGSTLAPGEAASLKRDLFRAILAEERPRLTAIPELFDTLEGEVG